MGWRVTLCHHQREDRPQTATATLSPGPVHKHQCHAVGGLGSTASGISGPPVSVLLEKIPVKGGESLKLVSVCLGYQCSPGETGMESGWFGEEKSVITVSVKGRHSCVSIPVVAQPRDPLSLTK